MAQLKWLTQVWRLARLDTRHKGGKGRSTATNCSGKVAPLIHPCHACMLEQHSPEEYVSLSMHQSHKFITPKHVFPIGTKSNHCGSPLCSPVMGAGEFQLRIDLVVVQWEKQGSASCFHSFIRKLVGERSSSISLPVRKRALVTLCLCHALC